MPPLAISNKSSSGSHMSSRYGDDALMMAAIKAASRKNNKSGKSNKRRSSSTKKSYGSAGNLPSKSDSACSLPESARRVSSLENIFAIADSGGRKRQSSGRNNATWNKSFSNSFIVGDVYKEVRFKDHVNTSKTIESRHDEDFWDIFDSYWWSKSQLQKIREDAYKMISFHNENAGSLAQLMKAQDTCPGLERFLGDEQDIRRLRQQEAVRTVLDLQYILKTDRATFLEATEEIADLFDPDDDASKIGFYYRNASNAATEAAFDSALLLKMEAGL